MGSFPCEGPFCGTGEKYYRAGPQGTLLCLCPEHLALHVPLVPSTPCFLSWHARQRGLKMKSCHWLD